MGVSTYSRCCVTLGATVELLTLFTSQASMPKQYLQLLGQPIAMHSLNTFGSMREVGEIIVVCDPSYRSAVCRNAGSHVKSVNPSMLTHSFNCRDLFQQYLDHLPSEVQHSFALPGIERQDSVLSGLQAISSKSALVAVHDSARPLLQAEDAAACMLDAQQVHVPKQHGNLDACYGIAVVYAALCLHTGPTSNESEPCMVFYTEPCTAKVVLC